MTASPTYRDFTFKVKAKITPRLSQMKANERARKLGKGSNSIFISALAHWFLGNSSWRFDSIIPRSPAENSVGKGSGLQSHATCFCVWRGQLVQDICGQGTPPHWCSVSSNAKKKGGTAAVLSPTGLLWGWTELRYTCQIIVPLVLTLSLYRILSILGAQSKYLLSSELFPDPPLTSYIISYLRISCGLSPILPLGSLCQS